VPSVHSPLINIGSELVCEIAMGESFRKLAVGGGMPPPKK
jgi:hypothetical protein